MKNKIKFSCLILLVGLALFLIPTAQAAYDCPHNLADPSTCCLDGEDGYQGVYCNPGEYIQKIGSNSPSCKTSAEMLTRAGEAGTKNFVGFNCFDNRLNKTCQTGLCYNPSADACQAFAGPNPACDALNRKTNCDQSCDGCTAGNIQCGGACQEPDPVTCGDGYEPDYCTGTCGCEKLKCPHFVWQNGLATCLIYEQRGQYCKKCSDAKTTVCKTTRIIDHQHCIDFPQSPFLNVIKSGVCGYKFTKIK